MIIKNADEVIKDTLEAIKPYLDYWTILDTGSEDDTVKIIKETMKGLEGQLFQEPFISFSESRNRVLDLAGYSCKYVIMLDDSYILQNGSALRRILSNTNIESLEIGITTEEEVYYSKRIFRADCKLRYKYRIHEIIDGNPPKQIVNYFDTKCFLIDRKTYKATNRSMARLPHYLQVLTEDHKNDPTDSRIVYYLGNTYFGLKEYEKAIEFYQKRAKMQFGEEVYVSLYVAASCMENLERPLEEIVNAYSIAFQADPIRAEPLYRIATLYYKRKMLDKALELCRRALTMKIPTTKMLHVEYNVYNELLPVLTITILLEQGKKQDAKKIFSQMNTATTSRMKNIEEVLNAPETITVQRHSIPFAIIHTGTHWDIDTMKFTSGSEIMAKNVALELARRGYRVFVFVKDIEEKTIDGVEYKNAKNYEKTLDYYYVDVLIVSRFTENLFYKEGTQKVFLWVHDVLPHGHTFYTHKNKFKRVLCLCNWHKEYFCKEFGFNKDLVAVTRNCIKPERFIGFYNTEKTPHRFIYSTDPHRGLHLLLPMFPKILARYPDAKLYLFLRFEDIQPPLRKIVKESDWIVWSPRVSQEQIAIEYLKSDIWLYPTDFTETYCITCLEAQASGLLCATYKVGSLPEIVGDRGILADNEEEMLKKLFLVMDNPAMKNILTSKARAWATRQDITNLIDDWEQKLFTL